MPKPYERPTPEIRQAVLAKAEDFLTRAGSKIAAESSRDTLFVMICLELLKTTEQGVSLETYQAYTRQLRTDPSIAKWPEELLELARDQALIERVSGMLGQYSSLESRRTLVNHILTAASVAIGLDRRLMARKNADGASFSLKYGPKLKEEDLELARKYGVAVRLGSRETESIPPQSKDRHDSLEYSVDRVLDVLETPVHSSDPSLSGLSASVRAAIRADCERIKNALSIYSRLGKESRLALRKPIPNWQRPFCVDHQSHCKAAYTAGLKSIRRSFWTTTFPTSGFWVGNDPEIYSANHDMLTRLRGAEGFVPHESVRRLFILSRPLESEITYLSEKLHLKGTCSGYSEVRKLREKTAELARTMAALEQAGAGIRFVHEHESSDHLRALQRLGFDRFDSELAILDDSELHIYDGGSYGQIAGMRIYNDKFEHFGFYLKHARSYFQGLWQRGQSASEFYRNLIQSEDQTECRFDYGKTFWKLDLAGHLSPHDATIIRAEEKWLVSYLKSQTLWGRLRSHLDIGTCMGRYLFGLRDAVMKDGSIIGIDNDPLCVEFVRKEAAIRYNDPRIGVREMDFVSEERLELPFQFDLITCMLGTWAHFGWGCDETVKKDAVTKAFHRMQSLLSPSGIGIISRWSDAACRSKSLLDMYSRYDVERLAEWNPTWDQFRYSATHAGLSIEMLPSIGKLEPILVKHNTAA